jgi:hypothetical protein
LYPHVGGHRTLEHLLAPDEPNIFARLRDAGYHVALAGARGDMFAPGVTRASCDRFGFITPPNLEDVARWHSSPFEPGSKWYDAFYGGPIDGALHDFDAAAVRTAVDWLTERMPAVVPVRRARVPASTVHRGASLARPLCRSADTRSGPADPRRQARLPPGDPPPVRPRSPLAGGLGRDHPDLLRDGQPSRRLDSTGQAERTITFFFTDHGEYLGDYGLVEKWPAGVDDMLVHNPLIVHNPSVAAGEVTSLVEMIDLTATLDDFANLAPTPHFGRSLRPVLADPTIAHRDAAFSEGGFLLREEPWLEAGDGGQYRHKQAIQHERTELVGRVMAIRTADWCYVERLYEGPELYDRRHDPRETTNLAGRPEHAHLEHQLRERLFLWLFETSDLLPARRDPRFDHDLQRAILNS